MPLKKNNTPTIKFVKYWLPVISYATFIFCLSSLPGQYVPPLFSYQDVVFHIIEYSIFALLVNRALKAYYPGFIYTRRFILVFLLSFIYALSDEFHQAFVPDRFPSLFDLVYDGIGIFISNIFYR